MPGQKGIKGYNFNLNKHVLGRRKVIDIGLLQGLTSQPTSNINDLIIEFTTGENVTAQNAGTVVNGLLYHASNLLSNNKPAMGIILDTAVSGSLSRIQIAGYCNMSFGFTANKNVYLRYGAVNTSHTPLLVPTVNEDGFQIIGRALNTDILLINIEEFYQIQ